MWAQVLGVPKFALAYIYDEWLAPYGVQHWAPLEVLRPAGAPLDGWIDVTTVSFGEDIV